MGILEDNILYLFIKIKKNSHYCGNPRDPAPSRQLLHLLPMLFFQGRKWKKRILLFIFLPERSCDLLWQFLIEQHWPTISLLLIKYGQKIQTQPPTKGQHSNLKNEAFPEVRKTAIHRKSARGRSQKANVHTPMLKCPFSQHKFMFLQVGPMDFYCIFR